VADFVLVPGAGFDAGYWQALADRLADLGHRGLPVQLPCDDDAAGLEEYASHIAGAARGSAELVLVAHSFGGFSAALAAARLPARLLVYASAMVPAPGEKAEDWFAHTGWHAASEDFGALFYSDIEPRAKASVFERRQSDTPGTQPWPLPELPDVPTRAVAFADDLFFPPEFMRAVVLDRLGIEADSAPGGHLAMMSHPDEMASLLVSYL